MMGTCNMKKSIKSTKVKNIVVKCLDWLEEVPIDSEVFDDVYMEAATRSIEKKKDESQFKVAVVMECWEKKDVKIPDKHFVYNTYFVLVNAGLHTKAEMLRINFMKLHQIDLQKENIRGDNKDGGQPNSGGNPLFN